MGGPTWNGRYPDAGRLRGEVERLAECFVEALLDSIPRSEVRGIYLKGSATKRWDSPLDYVPEISDVDMHLWFHGDDTWRRHLGTLSQAMDVHRKVELRYRSKISQPIHEPRPQLIVMNKLMAEFDDFVFSPGSTVRVLFGEDYPEADYSDPDRIRLGDCRRLIENAEYLGVLPLQAVDKPGRYLWESLRALVWRVSPAGPRVLHVMGIETEEAWSLNRTGVVSNLRRLGQSSLADHYSGFYLSAWEYFLSGFKNTDAGRTAIGRGARVLSEASKVARTWLAGQPANAARSGDDDEL